MPVYASGSAEVMKAHGADMCSTDKVRSPCSMFGVACNDRCFLRKAAYIHCTSVNVSTHWRALGREFCRYLVGELASDNQVWTHLKMRQIHLYALPQQSAFQRWRRPRTSCKVAPLGRATAKCVWNVAVGDALLLFVVHTNCAQSMESFAIWQARGSGRYAAARAVSYKQHARKAWRDKPWGTSERNFVMTPTLKSPSFLPMGCLLQKQPKNRLTRLYSLCWCYAKIVRYMLRCGSWRSQGTGTQSMCR